jgi:two-component system, NtrC family, nitrogen regulation response regulator NtrX
MNAHILVVDDEPDICLLVKEILEDEGYRVTVAANADAARVQRREAQADLILLDIWMPGMDGISLLKEWHDAAHVDVPVIMMSGHGSVETAVEATRLGAYDFLEKPISMAKLLVTVQRALEMASLKRENTGLKAHSEHSVMPLGHSHAMQQLREQVKRIAQHDTAVLITGEAGCGRALFARYLHEHSPRAHEPFIQVRITGMDASGQNNELFCSTDNSGLSRLEQANKGTLFIKDIADLDSTIQARLLSVLENRALVCENNPHGIPLNLRIIAATAYEPEQAVSSGRLREDLYYYLNVVPLHVPPLREHYEDVPELLEFYVNQWVNQESLAYRRFTVAAQNRLRNYQWPGNVRELKNLVQRLLILGNHIDIDLDEVEPALTAHLRVSTPTSLSIFDLPLREAREQFERSYLEHQLQAAGGSVSKVATRVGLERTHLYRKLRALDIDPKHIKKS